MSKKLFSQRQWKEHIERRKRDELRKRIRRNAIAADLDLNGLPPVTARTLRKKRVRPYANITAPSVFSMVDNPEGMIVFLQEIEILARTHHISLDLSGVVALSTDAVGALVATIQKDTIRRDTNIEGNQPSNQEARRKLISTGFFAHVHSVQPMPRVEQGRISERKSKKVEALTARDLIRLGTSAIHGAPKRCQAAYRVLIECMNNTRNHASGQSQHSETWWASVYADSERGRVCYTFVDTGVGIFRSVQIGAIRKFYKAIKLKDDSHVLQEILEGKVESSTGKAYRGKGLPAIYEQARRGSIKSLVIVANDVYGNVDRSVYRMVPSSFRGTMLYWET